MKELLNNQDRIMNILKMHPKTRDNDMLLYLKLAALVDETAGKECPQYSED